MYCISVQFSHEAEDSTNPVVYFHFEEDQGWTNHGAQFVMEETPFADVSLRLCPLSRQIEVFTNSLQHKNTNIANFVLAVPFEMNMTNEIWNLNM